MTNIPLIDIRAARSGNVAARERVAAEIRGACMSSGFFLVQNHGISDDLVQKQFRAARQFFDLPVAIKAKYGVRKYSVVGRGWEGLDNAQILDADAQPDYKESYYCGIDYAPDHPLVLERAATYAPVEWPTELLGFGAQMTSYLNAVMDLGNFLMNMLARSLDLDENYFRPMFTDPMVVLRLLRYPALCPDAPARHFGAGAHTDWGAITILAQDEAGGLEVCGADGVWTPATPVPGTFVVNLGDMMPRWTRGLYRSNPHRVIHRGVNSAPRYSMPVFYDPNYNAVINCLPTLLDRPEGPDYQPCTVGEHIAAMYAKTYQSAPAQ